MKFKKSTYAFFSSIILFVYFNFTFTADKLILIKDTHATLLCSLEFIAFYFLLTYAESSIRKKKPLLLRAFFLLFSMFISGMTILGSYFSLKTQPPIAEYLHTKNFILFGGIIFISGIYSIYIFSSWIYSLNGYSLNPPSPTGRIKKGMDLFDQHTILFSLIFICICWIPHYIIRFPAAMGIDSWKIYLQAVGKQNLTTQHPILYTIVVYIFSKVGLLLGTEYIGIFLLILLQGIIWILAIVYTLYNMKKWNFSLLIRFGTLLFFATTPLVVATTTSIYSDPIYNAAFLVLMNEFIVYLYERKKFLHSPFHLILTIISIFGFYFRNNGFHILCLWLLLVITNELIILVRKKTKIMVSLLICVVFALSIISVRTLVNTSINYTQAKKVSTRASFSWPIQTCVRCLIYHEDEISQTEYDALHAVLTWDTEKYRQTYNPLNYDYVKYSFNVNATNDELKQFLFTWIKLLIRYPDTAFMDLTNRIYFLFDPFTDNSEYYYSMDHKTATVKHYTLTQKTYISTEKHHLFQINLHDYYEKFDSLPVIGFFSCQASVNILFIILCIISLFRKDKKYFLLTLPLLATLLIIVVGPAVYGHPKYTYPINYCIPLLLAMYLQNDLTKKS